MFDWTARQRWIFRVNVVFALALLVVYCVPFVNPSNHWWMGAVGFLYPSLFWINLLFVCFWVGIRKGFFTLSFFMLIVGYRHFSRTVGMDFLGDNVLTQGEFKICSYNARNFDIHDLTKEPFFEKQFQKYFSQQQPDVICLQEWFSHTSKQGYNYLDTLKKVGGYMHYYLHTEEANNQQYHGLNILSKYPILNKGKIDFYEERGSKNGSAFADIQFPGKIVRVYSIHLQSVQFGQGLDFKPSSKKEDVVKKLARAYRLRVEQMEVLSKHISESPYPVVVAGDFNEPPLSYIHQNLRYRHKLKDAFLDTEVGWGSTINSRPSFTRIDYVLMDSSFSAHNFVIEDLDLSDHLPMTVNISY